MDLDVFDDVARQAADGSSRRSLVRAGLGALGLTGLGLLTTPDDAAAKKKKGKKKKRCKGERPVTCGQGCCPSQYPNCCESASDPNAATRNSCNPASYTCCSISLGGGSCPPNTKCCGPTAAEFNEFGSCAPTSAVCCPADTKTDWCTTEFPVCCIDDCCLSGEVCADAEGNCPAGTSQTSPGCCELDAAPRSASRAARADRSGGAQRFRMKAR